MFATKASGVDGGSSLQAASIAAGAAGGASGAGDAGGIIPRGFEGAHVAVLGLGVTGAAVVDALLRGRADMVTVWDDDPDKCKRYQDMDKVRVCDLTTPQAWRFNDAPLQSIVVSPGIAASHPARRAIQGQMVPVLSDIDILWDSCPKARYLGITGSNGKSTVTSLVAQVLEFCKVKVVAGGNLGAAALSLPAMGSDGVYVIEMSSFQLLITNRVRFHAAALLNIFANHDTWHGSSIAYRRAKVSIFDRMSDDDYHVVGMRDSQCLHLAEIFIQAKIKAVPVSGDVAYPSGVFWIGEKMYDGISAAPKVVLSADQVRAFPGRHNADNLAAAYALLRSLDLEPDLIAKGLARAKPLPHRMEFLGIVGQVGFVNDSKATNVAAAAVALDTYKNIYWVAGGRGKDEDFAPLAKACGQVRGIYLIGEASDEMKRVIAKSHGDIPITICDTIEQATDKAFADASKSASVATVLLAPACSSFDMFDDFQARGDAFRQHYLTLALAQDGAQDGEDG